MVSKLGMFLFAFFASWLLIYQINWMDVFNVEENKANLEEKLGKLYWELISDSYDEIKSKGVVDRIDTILSVICSSNDIERENIKLHILENDMVNAVTLPDNYMIIFSGLIEDADSEEELAGVICHELAHMELNHIMKKLIKEVGMSILVSLTSGTGGEVVRETMRVLTSSAFDRELEAEADLKAVDYMIEAKLNPEGLSNFMYKMSTRESDLQKSLSWVSTHPASEERALNIVKYAKDKEIQEEEVLSAEEWDSLKVALQASQAYQ